MLIIGTLTVMLVISLFSIFAGGVFAQASVEGLFSIEGSLNGTTSTYIVGSDANIMFFIDPTQGAIVTITLFFITAAVVGIQIVGSGLNETSSRGLMFGIFYIGMWVIVSALAYPLIVSIEIFGSIIYSITTIVYGIGVVQKYFGE